jgi:CRP-like cAMP-binding protein
MTPPSNHEDTSRVAEKSDFEFLGTVEPFTVFPERWLSLMAGLMRVEDYREGEMIFSVSDLSDSVFVVRQGEVVVYTDTVGEPVQLMARVKPGEMFGEVGVLEQSRRTVAARAASHTTVLRLEASDLGRLGRASRRFGARLAQSALLRYMADAASKVELGQRGEVRIRVDKQVLLRPNDHELFPTRLDNLSRGGACLRGVPESWDLAEPAPIALMLEDETELLRAEARIAWRRGSSVGLAFCAMSPDHDTHVDAALDALLSDDSSSEEEYAF